MRAATNQIGAGRPGADLAGASLRFFKIKPSHDLDRTALGYATLAFAAASATAFSPAMDFGGLRGHLAPDVFERLRRHRGIAYRVRNASVTQEMLQSACVHPSIGQGVAGRMA